MAGAALLALAAAGQAVAQTPPPSQQGGARAWIQRMNSAVVNRNYDGVIRTQRAGQPTEVFRIVHRMKDGEMVERVISTDGSGYEQKRKGIRWAEFRPQHKTVVVATRNRSFGYIPALNGLDPRSAGFYNIVDGGQTRLLGRDVQFIQIDPRDNLRFGYRIWLDRESALPLRMQRTDADGKVLKEMAFISPPALPASIPDEQLKVELDTRNFRWVSWDRFTPMHNPELPRAYAPKAELLPPGYRSRIFNSPEEESTAKGFRSRYIVSDGVSWADVFLSPAGKPGTEMTGGSASGPLATYRLRLDDVFIVVMGEMPQATARAIAEAIRPE